MSAIVRAKRVSEPFGDKVKERIFGNNKPVTVTTRNRLNPVYISSGSEHSAENDDDSPSLSNLLFHFLNDKDSAAAGDYGSLPDKGEDYDSDDQQEQDCSSRYPYNNEELHNLKALIDPNSTTDAFENILLSKVTKAMDVFAFVKSDKSLLRRNVMAFLRSSGYNAAICKTKWENSSSGGLTAGSYEFIDVVLTRSDPVNRVSTTRYFIDLDFVSEFLIARQTNPYEDMLDALPRVFVGEKEKLKQVIKLMSDAARKSLKSRGLHLPPWRKNRFMQNKWFGPYRRTINFVTTNIFSSPTVPVKEAVAVKCRSVGFEASNFHATARTR